MDSLRPNGDNLIEFTFLLVALFLYGVLPRPFNCLITRFLCWNCFFPFGKTDSSFRKIEHCNLSLFIASLRPFTIINYNGLASTAVIIKILLTKKIRLIATVDGQYLWSYHVLSKSIIFGKSNDLHFVNTFCSFGLAKGSPYSSQCLGTVANYGANNKN